MEGEPHNRSFRRVSQGDDKTLFNAAGFLFALHIRLAWEIALTQTVYKSSSLWRMIKKTFTQRECLKTQHTIEREKHVKYTSTLQDHIYVTTGIEGFNFLISDKFVSSL